MDDHPARREHVAAPLRRVAAEFGANVSPQDGEDGEVYHNREPQAGPGRPGAAGRRMERRDSLTQGSHQRHMPMGLLNLPIPRKAKEKRLLLDYVSIESREYEDMKTTLTSSYVDTSSDGCFTYCKPRLVNNELLEKEFVEKRKEMKSDGRTDKELEESYCFLLADYSKVHLLCEKGLFVGQSWITVLGNPSKGVYLSRHSDLLQVNPMTPGATGDIIIFKVMKGKMKSIYENMKNLFDPTPRFDSHISKNASKVTSLTSYRAFELTQQYFYEYSFDELRQRPRQVCPYAVVSFHFKGKDSPLPSTPLAPIRLNSHSSEGSKERVQFTVWTGDLVKGDRVLFQICLRSFSPPILPHRLPDKLDIGWVMSLDQVTKLLPPGLFSYDLYSSSQEVVKGGHCCSLLEVTDRCRSAASVTRLLHELEMKGVVLVTPLTEGGFLFLLSSVQMATPSERGESWKRCLHALFVLPESRDVAKSNLRLASSSYDAPEVISGDAVMPRLSQFIPALHHALVKVRADPPPELSAGVERQAQEYFISLKESKVRQYPMGQYDSKSDEQGKVFVVPKHHRMNIKGYLGAYLHSPALYLLSVARAKLMVETHCSLEEQQEVSLKKSYGGQREAAGKEVMSNTRDRQSNMQKVQQLIDLVLTCKRNAENEVNREERGGAVTAPGRKRRREQETAERALKFLRVSQEPGKQGKIPVEGSHVSPSPGSLASVIGSLGLKDVDLREDGSEQATELLSLLTGLSRAARGKTNQSLCEVQEEGQRESSPFDKLAAKLGLPTNCDIDLRKQEDLEEQTTGSVSSLEGFSPSSHSGELSHYGAAGRGGWLGRREGRYEEDEEGGEIPWVLIPITGLCSERYSQRDRNVPQDPRFQRFTTVTSVGTAADPSRRSPTLSPDPSPFLCPSPELSPPPSPSQCPSPDPSPLPSPSQYLSPEPSPPRFPSQCPSPEPSSPPSPHRPSPEPNAPPSPSQRLPPKLSHCPSQCRSPEPNELRPFNKDQSGANEEQPAPCASREFAGLISAVSPSTSYYVAKMEIIEGVFLVQKEKPQEKEQNEEPSTSSNTQLPVPPALQVKTDCSPSPAAAAESSTEEVKRVNEEPPEKETKPLEAQKGGEEAALGEEHVVEMINLMGSDEEQKLGAKELSGGSLFSPPDSATPSLRLQHIDSIVDKHLGEFSSDIQLVLQKQSVHYSSPQSPHASADAAAPQPTRPRSPISRFSPYVSFYNACPPVQDYVSSLHESINSMLTEVDGGWPGQKAASSSTNTDPALASKVSAFVSSIRAANATAGDDAGPCGGVAAADRGGEVCRPHTVTHDPDAANDWNPSTSHVTLSVTTSAPGPAYKPTSSALSPHPSTPPASHRAPQRSQTIEVKIRQTQDSSVTRTVHCTDNVQGTSCKVTLSGLNSVSKPLAEQSLPPGPVSNLDPAAGPPPPATALSSLIRQLQPEVFTNLEEIMKDIKKNSSYFYFHSVEPEDQVYKDVREHLLKQGNVEQSPRAFVNQDNSDSRLLVIIQNKDIVGHIHKIPGLVALKRHPSVAFVGIDTLDDIANKNCSKLFVSGGCIISDESVLNPDFITHDRLTALLMLLEQHSSPESIWKWKVHCRTHKKLKEQSRFRRDAANLLDVLSTYQERQVVEFLPYHSCDMMNQHSPDQDCLMELQARHTKYRHTVLLTEHRFVEFPAYFSRGIILASPDEILNHFTTLVGYHDIKDNQPMTAPKEDLYSLSFHKQPNPVQSSSGLPTLPSPPDVPLPDTSWKDGVLQHSGKDLEDLQRAILKLRAERQAQQQQRFEPPAETSISPVESFLPNSAHTAGHHTAQPLGQGGPSRLALLNPGKKAMTAFLDSFHSALQLELDEQQMRKGRTERRSVESPGGGVETGDQRDGAPVTGQNLVPNNCDKTIPSSYQNTGSSKQMESANDGRKRTDQHGEPSCSKAATQAAAPSSSPADAEVDRSRLVADFRDSPLGQEQSLRPDGAAASSTKVLETTNKATDQVDDPNPAGSGPEQIQPSHRQQGATSLQQQPPLPQPYNRPPLYHRLYSHSPFLAPLSSLRGGLLGPMPVQTVGMNPASAAALLWGFPPVHRDFTGPRLLTGYHNPAGQGSNIYRGGRRGGGFNGM